MQLIVLLEPVLQPVCVSALGDEMSRAEEVQSGRPRLRASFCINLCCSHNDQGRRCFCFDSRFTDEETETQSPYALPEMNS